MYDKNKTLDTLKNEIFLSKDNLYLAEEAAIFALPSNNTKKMRQEIRKIVAQRGKTKKSNL